MDFLTAAIMAGMGFVAAFIDSVVGGGGLISVPTLMWAGLPMLNVLGTNKVASCMGAFAGFLTYLRSGKLDRKIMRVMFPLAFVGSIGGVLTVRQVPSDFLRPLVVVMLIVIAIYSVAKKIGARIKNPFIYRTKIIYSDSSRYSGSVSTTDFSDRGRARSCCFCIC